MSDKKRGRIKRAELQPAVKSMLLEKLCNDEQLALIRDLVSKGCAFIVLGDTYAPVRDFQKGLMQEMRSPTSNGIALYDTHYRFRFSHERPVVTISVNDSTNRDLSIVDSVKLLDRYRSRTLYTYHYEEM